MKKFLFNIFLFIIFLLIIEFIAFIIHSKGDIDEIKLLYNKSTLEATYITFNNFYNPVAYDKLYYKNSEFRKPIIRNIPNNKEIVLYGCSFTHGFTLPENETFHSHLSNYTNYNIYNYGLSGGGPREILYMLSDIKEPKTNTKYVIYTFIPHHKVRLMVNFRPKVPFYINHNGKLKYLHYNPLFSSSLLFYWQYYIQYRNKAILDKEDKLFLLYLKEMNKLIKEKYPNAHFVILVFAEINSKEKARNEKIWKEMEDEGVTVLFANNITGVDVIDPEYVIPNDFHPNSKAWEVITPALAKELKL